MKYIEVEGVVLTPNAIAQLQELQTEKSEVIADFVTDLDGLSDILLNSSRGLTLELSEKEVLRNILFLRDLKHALINLKHPNTGNGN